MNYIYGNKDEENKLLDRFCRYVKIWSESDGKAADAGTFPSTEQQWDIAKVLVKELRNLGTRNVYLTDYCYVVAKIDSNITDAEERKNYPTILLMAHMDTVDEVTGKNVKPVISMLSAAESPTGQADTIISNEEIWFSKPEKPDVLLALTQASMNKFSRDTTPGSVIIADTGLSIPANCAASKIYRIPILETASKVVGKAMTANIVAVAAINTLLNLFPDEILQEAVKMHIPAGTEALNMKAFEEGKRIAENAKVVFTSAFMTPEQMTGRW